MNLSQLQTACHLPKNIAPTVNYPVKKVTATEVCLKLAESHLSIASSHWFSCLFAKCESIFY